MRIATLTRCSLRETPCTPLARKSLIEEPPRRRRRPAGRPRQAGDSEMAALRFVRSDRVRALVRLAPPHVLGDQVADRRRPVADVERALRVAQLAPGDGEAVTVAQHLEPRLLHPLLNVPAGVSWVAEEGPRDGPATQPQPAALLHERDERFGVLRVDEVLEHDFDRPLVVLDRRCDFGLAPVAGRCQILLADAREWVAAREREARDRGDRGRAERDPEVPGRSYLAPEQCADGSAAHERHLYRRQTTPAHPRREDRKSVV